MVDNNTWGVTMMKDEEDVAFHTILHMAEEGLAGIIVADNISIDGTRDELDRVQKLVKGSCEVIIVNDNEPGYYQSQKMTNLAHMAGEHGAKWIIPFDADEIWYSREYHLGDWFDNVSVDINIVEAPLYNHFASGLDPDGKIPFETMQWRQPNPGALPKVACRYAEDLVIEQGNHNASYSGRTNRTRGGIELRHFPYRSFEQFKRKAINGAAAYNSTDLHPTQGAHWRQYGALLDKYGDAQVRTDVWEKYFWFFAPVEGGLILDPAPFRRWNK